MVVSRWWCTSDELENSNPLRGRAVHVGMADISLFRKGFGSGFEAGGMSDELLGPSV